MRRNVHAGAAGRVGCTVTGAAAGANAALARMHPSHRVAPVAGGTEDVDGKFLSAPERNFEIPAVLLATHAEIRKVVQEVAEDLVAILGILPGVQDVRMPELVDQLGGDDYPDAESRQLEKLPVLRLDDIGETARPPDTLVRIHQLALDGIEVEGLDLVPDLGLDFIGS